MYPGRAKPAGVNKRAARPPRSSLLARKGHSFAKKNTVTFPCDFYDAFQAKRLETGEQQQRATTVQRSIKRGGGAERWKPLLDRTKATENESELAQEEAEGRGGKKKHNSERKKPQTWLRSECVCVSGPLRVCVSSVRGGLQYLKHSRTPSGPCAECTDNLLVVFTMTACLSEVVVAAAELHGGPLDAAPRGSDDITRQKVSLVHLRLMRFELPARTQSLLCTTDIAAGNGTEVP